MLQYNKTCNNCLFYFDFVTKSKIEVFLYVAEEWGGFLVDRVGVSPFGYAGHGFCVCDVQAFLCPGHGDIEQPCGFPDFLRSLLIKERIDTIGCLEDDHIFKLQTFCLVDCRDHLYVSCHAS